VSGVEKLRTVLIYLRKVFVAIWIGKIVFFAAGVAPTVFRVLTRPDAAALQAQIFPKYFGLGLIATTAVLVLSLLLYRSDRTRGRWHSRALLALAALSLGIYANLLFNITPEILRLQPEVLLLPKGSTETIALQFAEIHSLSTALNLAVLVLGLVCLALV
jgi:hypothetical protein